MYSFSCGTSFRCFNKNCNVLYVLWSVPFKPFDIKVRFCSFDRWWWSVETRYMYLEFDINVSKNAFISRIITYNTQMAKWDTYLASLYTKLHKTVTTLFLINKFVETCRKYLNIIMWSFYCSSSLLSHSSRVNKTFKIMQILLQNSNLLMILMRSRRLVKKTYLYWNQSYLN